MGWFTRYDLDDVVFILKLRTEKIMSAVQDAVDQITAQLSKAQAEIVAKIADLEAAIAAGETPDLTALKAAAQALDDVVVDVVPDEPAEPTE